MLLAEQSRYDYLIEEPIYKPRKKVKKKLKTRKYIKTKYFTFVMLGLIIALTILMQYAKLNIINQEINSLEKELQELHMLNDSLEGELLAKEDLKEIEQIAKKDLGMVEAEVDQMTTIEIQGTEDIKIADARTENTPSAGFLEALSQILN